MKREGGEGNVMKKNIIIYGNGGHSKVVMDAIEKSKQYSIYGLIDDKGMFASEGKHKYIGDQSSLKSIIHKIDGGIVAIGDNWIRSEIVLQIKESFPNFKFVSVIHPSAIIASGVKVGDGTVIMPGVVVNSNSTIGEHCVLNTRCSIDHDGLIGDYVSIAPGATLGGNVSVGNHSVVSLGANIIHSKKIGEHSVIGAGATVLNDIDSHVVAYGTPAKAIRYRKKGEKYL